MAESMIKHQSAELLDNPHSSARLAVQHNLSAIMPRGEPSAVELPRKESTVTGSALSLNEQWLWLIERLTPGSIGRTTATLGRRIRGPLDLDRLNRCVTELVRRHQTLRTTFVVRDGLLRRVVSPDPAPGWIWRDFSDEPASEREAQALAFMD